MDRRRDRMVKADGRPLRVFVTGTRGIPRIMGGVEVHCEALFPRLAAMGFDVTMARRRSYVAADAPRDEWNGVKIVDLPTPRKKAFEAILHTVRAVWEARRRGADIIHIHAVGPALAVPLARMLGLKVVFTHHGFDYNRAKWGRVARWMLRLGESFGCRYAHRVIAISASIRDHVAQRYGRDDVTLIPNGAPAAEPTEDPDFFAQLGIEPRRYILSTCRFVPEKNLHHLVEAYAALKETCPAVREGRIQLVLAGDADFADAYSEELKARARALGVVLPGFVSGAPLRALLSNARAFVLPSSHEGLPIALLEAMAYSLPVAVSDIGPNLEVGLPTECYFPVGDVAALAKRLGDILEPGVPERVAYDLSRYDWDAIALQVADLYRSIFPRKDDVP